MRAGHDVELPEMVLPLGHGDLGAGIGAILSCIDSNNPQSEQDIDVFLFRSCLYSNCQGASFNKSRLPTHRLHDGGKRLKPIKRSTPSLSHAQSLSLYLPVAVCLSVCLSIALYISLSLSVCVSLSLCVCLSLPVSLSVAVKVERREGTSQREQDGVWGD